MVSSRTRVPPRAVPVSNITCRIRSGTALGGTQVRELTVDPNNGTLGPSTSGTATWDGKDGTGAFVAEGVYTARAYSPCNDENDASKLSITVDNTNPTISLLSPADGILVSGSPTFSAAPLDLGGNDSNIGHVDFFIDSAPVITDSSSSRKVMHSFNSPWILGTRSRSWKD